MSANLLWQQDLISNGLNVKLDDGHCIANVGIGDGWMTIYFIETEAKYRNKGEATRLILALRERAHTFDREFRVWCPMNEIIEHICEKYSIEVIKG